MDYSRRSIVFAAGLVLQRQPRLENWSLDSVAVAASFCQPFGQA
jgi:hypothetical protein